MSFADADHEARVSIGRAVGSGDEVIGLEDEVAVFGVAVAGRKIVIG